MPDETSPACGGAVRIMRKALAARARQALACIEDPLEVTEKIIAQLDAKGAAAEVSRRPPMVVKERDATARFVCC